MGFSVRNGLKVSTSQCVVDHYVFSSVGALFPETERVRVAGPTIHYQWLNSNGTPHVFSALDYAQYLAGKFYFAAQGIIFYEDVFHVHHWTKFCEWFAAPTNFGGNYQARSCSAYAGVDGNE